MDIKLLSSINELCEKNNAKVRGIVCELGNGKLLKELQVYAEKTHFFLNPFDNCRKVYIFPDVPHCLKNLRNHCLDQNLCIKQSEKKIVTLTKQHFQELLISDNDDFKLCPKLSVIHLECKGNDRQRVKYAVQLFSDTVSKALTFKFGKSYSEQAEVISTIDAWFDVMDSRTKFHWKNNKCALGVHENEQINVLNKMLDLVNKMYFGKDSLKKKPFQTGIIVSIKATLDLYEELKTEGFSFLLTSRLNQDSLENVFSQLRALGGNNTHPSSVQTINRIRTLCLSKNVNEIVSNSSVEMSNEDTFLSVDLLDELHLDIHPDMLEPDAYVDDELHELELNSNEPRNYVAGYICNKLNLVQSNKTEENSWISIKGEGRLKVPSSELLEIIGKCDDIFDDFHGKGLRVGKNPLEKLNALILKKHPNFPPKIVILFCKVKFFSRIRYLNIDINVNKLKSVRSFKQMAQFKN